MISMWVFTRRISQPFLTSENKSFWLWSFQWRYTLESTRKHQFESKARNEVGIIKYELRSQVLPSFSYTRLPWLTDSRHTNTRSVMADWFSPRAETEVHMKHLPWQFSCFTFPMYSYLYTYGFFRMKNMQHHVPLCCCTTASDPPTSVYFPAVRAAPQLTFALSHCS